MDFDYALEYHERGEKYVLTKKAQLWAVEADEYVFIKEVDNLNKEALLDYFELQKSSLFKIVNPRPDHMSSAVILLLICGTVEENIPKLVKKLKFRKNFKLSFWGWADALVAVVDLSTKKVYTNSAAKHLRKSLELNLKFD